MSCCTFASFEDEILTLVKNIPLEEIAKCFDGDSAMVGGGGATAMGRAHLKEMGEDDSVYEHEPKD